MASEEPDDAVAQQQQTPTVNAARPAERAIEMRSAGFTYRQIADALRVSVSTAHKYVQKEILKQRTALAESREDIRDLDLKKLAWLEQRLMQAASGGDLAASRLLLASVQLRRLYLKDLPPIPGIPTEEAMMAQIGVFSESLCKELS